MTAKNRALSSALSIVISLWLVVPTIAQTATKPGDASQEQKKARQELEDKIYALAAVALKEAEELRLPGNRAQVCMTAFDLLSDREGERAKAFVRDSAKLMAEMIESLDPRDQQSSYLLSMIVEFRRRAVQQIGRRDPELAVEFLRTTTLPPQIRPYRWPRENDLELQLRYTLASEVIGSDSIRGLRLAEETLKEGLSRQVTNVLMRLASRDRASAERFAAAIVNRLREEDFSTNYESAQVAVDMLRFGVSERRTLAGVQPGRRQMPALIGIETLRELAALVTSRLSKMTQSSPASQSSNSYYLASLFRSVASELNDPGGVPEIVALRIKAEEFGKLEEMRRGVAARFEELARTGTVETLLAAVGEAPPEMRYNLYHMAASKAAERGDLELARKIIQDNLPFYEQGRMLADVEREAVEKTLRDGKLAEALDMARRNLGPAERAQFLASQATGVFSKGDAKLAEELLAEAHSLVPGRAASQGQLSAQFSIARAYARVNPSKGFDLIEPIVTQINEFADAHLVLNGFYQETYRDGEMMLIGNNVASLLNLTGDVLGQLARADFERARQNTERFQRFEARVIVRLYTAQSAIQRLREESAAASRVRPRPIT